MSDEMPVIISSRTIAYALLGLAYSIKHTKQTKLIPTYEKDRAELQELLRMWDK